jgi:AAA family ATPase
MYVGESERAVRNLFARARHVAPSMIFFDEIDSIGGQRHGLGGGGGASATTSHGGLNVLTTLLNEMDGFETTQGVLVLAATNRPQALDPALLRPGRFDELIYVGLPDAAAREAIFRSVAGKRKWMADVDVARLVRLTDGSSGAEVVGICRTAGKAAYRRYVEGGKRGAYGITMEDLLAAKEMHPPKTTREMLRSYEEWHTQFSK